jgi:hypothetical protein
MPALYKGAVVEVMRKRGVSEWPRGSTVIEGGANSWLQPNFCVKTQGDRMQNADELIIISSFIRIDGKCQVQTREEFTLFGQKVKGQDIIDIVERELAKKPDLVLPYRYKHEVTEDGSDLKARETKKEERAREKSEQDAYYAKGGGKGSKGNKW